MSFLNESSYVDLYNSAVAAFPNTRKRQHATDPVVIETLSWTPFVGVNTLFIRAEARNETRHYSPMVLFKDVNYKESGVKIIANDGKEYAFAKLSPDDTDVLVRCNCPDFHWRFNYYDWVDQSLYGRCRKPYEATRQHSSHSANPSELPGMCKHVMKVFSALRDAGLFVS